MLDFFTSQLFLTVLSAWFMADIFIKFVVTSLSGDKTPISKRIFTTGGFPSSHTALVITLFMSLGMDQGWDNPITAVAGVLAIIVMYDAVNIRYQAGLHAKALNKLNEGGKLSDHPFKERLGHRYYEVLGGIILGIIVALVSYKILN